MLEGIRVAGTGRYAPETIVSNDDMSKMVDTSDEWISTRTGIRNRRMVKGEPTSYMAVEASRQALEGFDGSPEDIGLIICSTLTPDFYTPSVSCLVQAALGAKNAFCIDINCACTGFVQALDMAYKYIRCGDVRHVLIVSAEVLSHITDFSDRSTCVLFGDGAGACIVSADEGRFASSFGADGTGAPFLYASHLYPKTPFEDDASRTQGKNFDYIGDGFLHMNGKEVYKFAVSVMPRAVEQACGKMGITPQDIDLVIPHQANIRIMNTAMKNLRLPQEKAFYNIEDYGNTSSATIPFALDEAVRQGRIKKGDVIALVGFGAGLTFGAAVFDW